MTYFYKGPTGPTGNPGLNGVNGIVNINYSTNDLQTIANNLTLSNNFNSNFQPTVQNLNNSNIQSYGLYCDPNTNNCSFKDNRISIDPNGTISFSNSGWSIKNNNNNVCLSFNNNDILCTDNIGNVFPNITGPAGPNVNRIAPRKPIADSGWGNNYPFFLVDKGWYDIVGQGARNDYCRFVGGYRRDNLACILSKDNINSTSKFGDINNYSTTYKGQNVLDIARLQFTPPFPVYSSPDQVTSDGFYWYETADPAREPVKLYTKVNLADGKNWVRVFSSPFASTATVNEVGKSIPFRGFLIQPSDGSFQTYSYFSSNQLFNLRNSTALTVGGNKAGFAVYIGYAGGHGFYNVNISPIQTPCNWTNSVGMVGAGFDGICGSFPNALRWGVGQSGTPVCNMVPVGTVWETWITWGNFIIVSPITVKTTTK
jgi:hypothetical protein